MVTSGQAGHIPSSGSAASPQASSPCSKSPQAEPRAPSNNGWTVQSPVVAGEPVPVPVTSKAVSEPRESIATVIINGWKVVKPANGQNNGSGNPIQASPNLHHGPSNGDVMSRSEACINANGNARVTSPPIISVGWDDEAPNPASAEPSSGVTPAAAWDPNSVKIPSPGYPAASKGRSPHNVSRVESHFCTSVAGNELEC
jgi:hypothetical protein